MGGAPVRTPAIVLAVLLSLSAAACRDRPEKLVLEDRPATCPSLRAQAGERGLWLGLSDHSRTGVLGRMELATCRLSYRLLETAQDALLAGDGAKGLFLLNRMTDDSLISLGLGPSGEASVTAEHKLPERSNPQSAARDERGRVWVVSQDSNDAILLSPDLGTELGRIDLSELTEANSPAGDGHPELAQVVCLPDSLFPGARSYVLVTAQRQRRSTGGWVPESRGGYAILSVPRSKEDSPNIRIEKTGDLPVSNPLAARLRGTELWIAGAGNLASTPGGPLSGFVVLGIDPGGGLSEKRSWTVPYRILDADLGPDGEEPALIAYYPEEKQSCIQIGERKLVCEGSAQNGGFVFRKLLRVDQTVFASFSEAENGQLWLVPAGSSGLEPPIQRLNTGPTADTLVLGP
jgi:hypothetical protein